MLPQIHYKRQNMKRKIWKEWELTNLNYSSFVAKSLQERIKEMKRDPVSFSEVVPNMARSIPTCSFWKMSAERNFTYFPIHLLTCLVSLLQIKMSRLIKLSTLYKVQAFLYYVAVVSSASQANKDNYPYAYIKIHVCFQHIKKWQITQKKEQIHKTFIYERTKLIFCYPQS